MVTINSTLQELTNILNRSNSVADIIFKEHNNKVKRLHSFYISAIENQEKIVEHIKQTQKDINEYCEKPHHNTQYVKQDNYAKTLTEKRILATVAETYRNEHKLELKHCKNLVIDTISEIVESMSDQMKQEVSKGKLAIVELSPKLSITMNFPGSSSIYAGAVIPYSREFRTSLGEKQNKFAVSKETAIESAKNLLEKHDDVGFVIAETSMAPTAHIPVNGRPPQIFIAGMRNNEYQVVKQYQMPDVIFREHFDAKSAEKMLYVLKNIYYS